MGRRRLERLFVRWREKRDVSALTRVFDATSRELLELASHVARDPAEAEDLVQATFLAAIEHAERFDAERDLVAWLVGILVREARLTKRRAARRPEPGRLAERGEPDPADEAQRLELSAALERALERVPAPYREVLAPYLCDGRSPSEIARALERAPGTVRVQIHRGLELLRRALPAGAVAGAAALVLPTRGLAALRATVVTRAVELSPIPVSAGAAAAAVALPLVLGGIAVKKLAIAAVALSLGLCSWIAWRANDVAGPASPLAHAAVPSAGALQVATEASVAQAYPEPAEPASSEPSERTALTVSEPKHGALRVTLVWAGDKAPAAGVGVRLGAHHGAVEGEREVVADASGIALFERVPPGTYELRLDRVQVSSPAKSVAGEERELTLEVPDGLTVDGRVLDSGGNAVAGADVLLSSPWTLGGIFLAGRSANDGSYHLRGATPMSAVGARSPGWVPTLMPILFANSVGAGPLVHVDLLLEQRAGALAGRVLDADGRPVQGASVAIGRQQWEATEGGRGVRIRNVERNDGLMCLPPAAQHVTTDAGGAFAAQDVEIGEVELRVRVQGRRGQQGTVPIHGSGVSMEGRPEWRGTVQVRSDEKAWTEIRLARGAAVEGRILLTDRSPAKGIDVRAIDGEGSLGESTRSDADGRFRLSGLNAGTLRMSANESRRQGHAPVEIELEVLDGDTATWEPTLPRAIVLSGIALDEGDKPLSAWQVQASVRNKPGYEWLKPTDVQGRFSFEAVPGEAYDLRLLPPQAGRSDPPYAALEAVRAEDGEVELRVSAQTRPSAFLRGRLLDPDGAPARGGHLHVRFEAFPWHEASASTDAHDGSFAFGPLVPRAYELFITSERCPLLRLSGMLAIGETLDLGVIQLREPGDVLVRVRAPAGADLDRLRGYLASHRLASYLEGEGEGAQRELEPTPQGSWIARRVSPGPLTLVVKAPGCAQVRREVELAEGASLELEVVLERGARCPLQVLLPPGTELPIDLQIAVRDPAGVVRQEVGEHWDGSAPIDMLLLPPGAWRIEVRDARTEWSGAAAVEVASPADSLAPLPIALEPPR